MAASMPTWPGAAGCVPVVYPPCPAAEAVDHLIGDAMEPLHTADQPLSGSPIFDAEVGAVTAEPRNFQAS